MAHRCLLVCVACALAAPLWGCPDAVRASADADVPTADGAPIEASAGFDASAGDAPAESAASPVDAAAVDAPIDAMDDAPAACDGPCPPEILAAGLHQPGSLAVDDANVYWVEEGYATAKIRKCPIQGCATPEDLGAAGANEIATDGRFVYWADFDLGTIFKCAVGGCAQSPTQLVSGQGGIIGPVFDGTNLYWTTSDSGGSIRTCTPDACASPTTLAEGQGSVIHLAAEPSAAVWTTPSAARTCPASGCALTPTTLAPSSGTGPVALGGGTAVWIPLGRAVVACSVAGCGGTARVIGASDTPLAVTTDGVNVYWYDDTSWQIYRCPVDGCRPGPDIIVTPVIQSTGGGGMAVRGQYLYVATSDAVIRVRK